MAAADINLSGSRDVIEGAGEGSVALPLFCLCSDRTAWFPHPVPTPSPSRAKNPKKNNNKEGRGGKKQAMSKRFQLEAARYRGTVTHARDLR